jgi:3-methyladenine DNA glycosylase AlkC
MQELSERQQKLVERLFDNECRMLELAWARRLLKRNSAARQYFETLKQAHEATQHFGGSAPGGLDLRFSWESVARKTR